MNSFLEFAFLLLLFFPRNYHPKQFFKVLHFLFKFIILFSSNSVAPLTYCFDLKSTKIYQPIFFSLGNFTVFLIYTFYFTFNFKRNFVILFSKQKCFRWYIDLYISTTF